MKFARTFFVLIGITLFFYACKGQNSFGTEHLGTIKSIPLTNVSGRIDHMDMNPATQVIYVAALGNNSLEVVDTRSGKIIQSIHGLAEPQGVVYIPQTNEFMVSNAGTGDCIFYDANSFQKKATVSLGFDADDVRYNPASKKIYVGYASGGIAVIDAVSHSKIGDVKLPAHPEGFQLDLQLKKIFVNLPDAGKIDVIDLDKLFIVGQWKTDYRANFPMAIDTVHHVLFVGYRHPSKIVAINSDGKTLASADLAGDTDDLFYDSKTKKVYASCGNGSVEIYQLDGAAFNHLASIPTRNGSRTSFMEPGNNLYILAERAISGQPAQLVLYKTK